MSIREFLAKNPSLPDIVKFIEREAVTIANQRRKEQLQQAIQQQVSKNLSTEVISITGKAEEKQVK